MSYEGYFQILCEQSHLTEVDCYEAPNIYGDEGDGPAWFCECGARAVWYNSVDLTNGSECYKDYNFQTDPFAEPVVCEGCEFCDKGRIDNYIELKVKELAVVKVCECCGESKKITETTYYIPEGKGHMVE